MFIMLHEKKNCTKKYTLKNSYKSVRVLKIIKYIKIIPPIRTFSKKKKLNDRDAWKKNFKLQKILFFLII